MNKINSLVLINVFFILFGFSLNGQENRDASSEDSEKVFVITKNDGSQFVGKIISQDAREVLIETKELGQVFIPRHEIREIRETVSGEVGAGGSFMPSEVFSTRYFITTNGLPVKKGETYVLWNLYGPDFQFGLGENVGAGIMTSWIGIPIIGSIKYSIPVSESFNAGVGLLLGTGSWAAPSFAMALPYGVLTFGDRVKNINFSVGYGGFRYETEYIMLGSENEKQIESEGNFLVSVAGMVKISRTVSLVFDSFIVPRTGTYQELEDHIVYDPITGIPDFRTRYVTKDKKGIALIIPGLRFQTKPNNAFQFGFAGIRYDGETQPVPIPMVQWFVML